MAVRIAGLEEKVMVDVARISEILSDEGSSKSRSIVREDQGVIDVRMSASEVGQELEELVGEQELDALTEHAWLVVLGQFAQSLGLIEELEEVSLKQKAGANGKPQSKLIEFLVGILGGIEQLNELNEGSHPIALDETIAEAWGQEIFSHYSQVSRTLSASDEETLSDVVAVIRKISEPYIQQSVLESIKQCGRLTVDVDLTGREVSPTSESYEGSDFGWMDNEVKKGYQAAITSLVCERWGRLMLSLQRYPGRTLSAACLQAEVTEVEQVLQVRPRRRVGLVQARLTELDSQLAEMATTEEQLKEKEVVAWAKVHTAKQALKTAQAEVDRLSAEYQALGRVENKPYSQLGKCKRKLTQAEKQLYRAERDRDKAQRLRRTHQEKMMTHYTDRAALSERLSQLQADNAANPNPVAITLRIDAGFSHGINLAWLIEMGYTVLTKAHHNSSAQALRKQLPDNPQWTTVGKNAEAMAMGNYFQNNCPYPLQAMLIRYHLPDKTKYTALFYYDENPPPQLNAWFQQYNLRQTIEAGIKEAKAVFTLKRHLVRSPFGMQIQEQFALFAANFTRWAAQWVKEHLLQANSSFSKALGQVKTLAKTVSRASARWIRNPLGTSLVFEDGSPFAGTIISLNGLVAFQLPLPLFNFFPT